MITVHENNFSFKKEWQYKYFNKYTQPYGFTLRNLLGVMCNADFFPFLPKSAVSAMVVLFRCEISDPLEGFSPMNVPFWWQMHWSLVI